MMEPVAPIRPTMRYFTSHQVGDILQVNPSSVVKWINDGILDAFRTPGGHRRVAASELVRFARYHGMPVPEELRELSTLQIIAVDDEARFLGALERALKPFEDEMAIQTVDNGVDALLLVGALKPDILILDLNMPGIDGFQVLERLHANPDTKHVEVIAVSAQMDEAAIARCKSMGAVECFSKPLKVPGLVETLRTMRKPKYQRSK